MTAAERKAKQRSKDLVRAREQQRVFNRSYRERLKNTLNADEIAKKKIQNATYQQNHRDKIKKRAEKPPQQAFATPQIKGKILKRVRKCLKGSEKQNVAVLKTLLNEHINVESPKQSFGHLIPDDVINSILQYYLNDDISSPSPNTKDFLTITENNKKQKIGLRFLQYPINEVYGMFRAANPNAMVGKSKFFSLRPKYVKPFSNTPHNICCCIIHENMRCRLTSLKRSVAIFSDINVNSDMHKNFVCENPSPDCFSRACDQCSKSSKFENHLQLVEAASELLTWSKWVKCTKRNTTEFTSYCNIEKVSKTGALMDLIDEINESLLEFLDHQFIKISQSKTFQNLIQQASSEDSLKAVLVFDFAEKFKIFHQNEPQSAHYGQKPVTIFTIAVYHRGFEAKAMASDVEKQTKEIIISYVDRILSNLPSSALEIEIFTDNAGSQFKNQYTLESLKTLQIRHEKLIRWNFFAPMHGKSVVDGIGGTIKRFVKNRILANNLSLRDASDLVESASSIDKIEVILMTPQEIQQRNDQLNLKSIIQTAKPIPDIKKKHSFEVESFIKGRKKMEKIVGFKISK